MGRRSSLWSLNLGSLDLGLFGFGFSIAHLQVGKEIPSDKEGRHVHRDLVGAQLRSPRLHRGRSGCAARHRRAFAYELVARGELPVIRLGRRRLVPKSRSPRPRRSRTRHPRRRPRLTVPSLDVADRLRRWRCPTSTSMSTKTSTTLVRHSANVGGGSDRGTPERSRPAEPRRPTCRVPGLDGSERSGGHNGSGRPVRAGLVAASCERAGFGSCRADFHRSKAAGTRKCSQLVDFLEESVGSPEESLPGDSGGCS